MLYCRADWFRVTAAQVALSAPLLPVWSSHYFTLSPTGRLCTLQLLVSSSRPVATETDAALFRSQMSEHSKNQWMWALWRGQLSRQRSRLVQPMEMENFKSNDGGRNGSSPVTRIHAWDWLNQTCCTSKGGLNDHIIASVLRFGGIQLQMSTYVL